MLKSFRRPTIGVLLAGILLSAYSSVAFSQQRPARRQRPRVARPVENVQFQRDRELALQLQREEEEGPAIQEPVPRIARPDRVERDLEQVREWELENEEARRDPNYNGVGLLGILGNDTVNGTGIGATLGMMGGGTAGMAVGGLIGGATGLIMAPGAALMTAVGGVLSLNPLMVLGSPLALIATPFVGTMMGGTAGSIIGGSGGILAGSTVGMAAGATIGTTRVVLNLPRKVSEMIYGTPKEQAEKRRNVTRQDMEQKRGALAAVTTAEEYLRIVDVSLDAPWAEYIKANNSLIAETFPRYVALGGTIEGVLQHILTPKNYLNTIKKLDYQKYVKVLERAIPLAKTGQDYVDLVTSFEKIPDLTREHHAPIKGQIAFILGHLKEHLKAKDFTLDQLKKLKATFGIFLDDESLTQLKAMINSKNAEAIGQDLEKILAREVKEKRKTCRETPSVLDVISGEALTLKHEVERATEGLCSICTCPYNAGEGVAMKNCGHQFCQDCVREHVPRKIKQGDFPILCLQHGCQKRIGPEDLNKIGMSQAEIDQWKRGEMASELRLNYQHKYCQGPDCTMMYKPAAKGATYFDCPHCESTTCSLCEKLHKGNMTCAQAEQYKSGAAEMKKLIAKGRLKRNGDDPEAGTLRPCYFCGTLTYRIDGCNAMKCENKKCGKEWDWNYGDPKKNPGYPVHDFHNFEQKYEPRVEPHF